MSTHQLVDMPVDLDIFSEGEESLLIFYAKLGWDSNKQTIDPSKIKLSEEDAKTCLDNILASDQSKENKLRMGILWIDKGPSNSANVPLGKVLLEDGWLKTDEVEGE